jgi:hypothetical protein
MTNEQRAFCLDEIEHYTDRDAFISDLALSSIWGGAEDAMIPADRIEELEDLWDIYHRSVSEILTVARLTMTQLSKRFHIPYRTVQNWCADGKEHRECPAYVRLMMQELLNL